MLNSKKHIDTIKLESALRTFQRFLGKPLRYSNRIEEFGDYDPRTHKVTNTYEIRFHEVAAHDFTFWLDPRDKKWHWSVTLYSPGGRWEPPSADEHDMEGEFDHLWQLTQEIVTVLLKKRLDDFLTDEGMYIYEVESNRWEVEARAAGYDI